MKKMISFAILPFLLLLLILLVACGDSSASPSSNAGTASTGSDPSVQQPSAVLPSDSVQQPSGDAAIGSVLTDPEATFDTSTPQLYVRATFNNEEDGTVDEFELALDQISDDRYTLYATTGTLKLDEFVFEVSDNSINLYHKDVFGESFLPAKDTNLSQDEVTDLHDSFLSMLSLLMPNGYAGVAQFRKEAPVDSNYVYTLIKNGEPAGKMLVDKNFGLISRLEDETGKMIFQVQEIRTSDLGIPVYK